MEHCFSGDDITLLTYWHERPQRLENAQCYGYRRVSAVLRREGIVVSEKIVRKIMHEEQFTIRRTKRKRYNAMIDGAIARLSDGDHPVIHSDRGGHYRWPAWIQKVQNAGLIPSMSKKGCSPDNAACEGFFGRLKNEMFYGRSWMGVSLQHFMLILDQYIHWYHEKRIKISLGAMSPVEYRQSLGLNV